MMQHIRQTGSSSGSDADAGAVQDGEAADDAESVDEAMAAALHNMSGESGDEEEGGRPASPTQDEQEKGGNTDVTHLSPPPTRKRWASRTISDPQVPAPRSPSAGEPAVNGPSAGQIYSWGNIDEDDESDSESNQDDDAVNATVLPSEKDGESLTCAICKRAADVSNPSEVPWYSTQAGQPVGPICLDCGCTSESFQQEGKSSEDCIAECNANGGRNPFASRFQVALLVQRGVTRKTFPGSDVGARTCVGQKIYFPKILVMAKDFSSAFQNIAPEQLLTYASDLQLGIGIVPNFTGTKSSGKEAEQELGFYIDPAEEDSIPPTVPRYRMELYHDSCIFHDELTLTKEKT